MLELPRTWGMLVRCVAPDPHLSLPFHICQKGEGDGLLTGFPC